MAINFLNTVDFNKNQLNFARIQNLGTDPNTANSSIGQIYFNTTADTLKQYVADDGTGNPGWTEVGSTTVKAGVGIGVTFAGGEATVRNTGLVTVLDGTYINLTKQGGAPDNTELTADLNAVDGTSVAGTRFLSKDNTWDVVSNVAIATATTLGTVELFSNTVQTVAATAVSATAARTYGVQFNSDDQMVVNVPWTDTNVVTYDLTTAPTGTAVRLTSSDAGDPAEDVTISGTTGRTAISRISATELRVDLTDDVTIIDDLTVDGKITQIQTGETNTLSSPLDMGGSTASVTPNKILNVATGTAGTDGVNLGQVELLVQGIGVFQGSYNAATNSPALEGGSNVKLDQGDYFVVSVAGTFLGEALEPGDFIFANNAIAANSSPALSNYTVVQADDNVAGAGATDGATQKGVSGFDSENFTVSSNGWVQLKPLANPYGAKVSLTSGDNTTAGQTTFTVDVTALFAGADARNCKVEVLRDAGALTVYPEVTRNGTGDVLLEFMPQVGNSLYSALITIV